MLAHVGEALKCLTGRDVALILAACQNLMLDPYHLVANS